MRKVCVWFLIFSFCFLAISNACAAQWVCSECGRSNSGNYCPECGAKYNPWICPSCGTTNSSAFCENCGTKKPFDRSSLLGIWKFAVWTRDLYVNFINDTTCFITVKNGGIQKCTYSITGSILSFETSEPISGTFKLQGDSLEFTPFGVGFRTEESPSFLVRMDGQSMDDTLSDGDILTVSQKTVPELRRFDVVVVYFPGRDSTMFVKRIVAFPGDSVSLVDGYLYINGERYNETYISDAYRSGYLNSFAPFTVPDNCCFVLGDHRNNSNDSRSIGPLSFEMVLGVVTKVNGKDLQAVVSSN